MKRLLLATAVALLCSCNANLGLQIGHTGRSATQPSVGPGGSFSSGGVGVQVSERASFGSILGAVGLGWILGRDPRTEDSRTPPSLDANRRVNEQDCTKPLQGTGNLRCN